jgi:ABC-2 type transport system ATP-binding protein
VSFTFTIPATNGAATLTEVVRGLDQAGVVPDDLALHRPSLDDVFLSLTGHTAEDKATDAGDSANHKPKRGRSK